METLRGRIGTGKLIAAGLAGGLVQGAAGVGGPPVVAVTLSRPGDAAQQRANVLALMTASRYRRLLPLLYYGLFYALNNRGHWPASYPDLFGGYRAWRTLLCAR